MLVVERKREATPNILRQPSSTRTTTQLSYPQETCNDTHLRFPTPAVLLPIGSSGGIDKLPNEANPPQTGNL